MRRKSGLIAGLAALALLTLAANFTPVHAEVYTALLNISPLNENPPITNLPNAGGGFLVTVDVTRDANGNITSVKMSYLGAVQGLPAGTVLTGLHIHEGVATTNGPVRFGTDLSGSNTQTLANGAGVVLKDVTPAPDPVIVARMLANPTGFYLNIHSSASPGGVMRGQLTRLTETLSNTVTMTQAQEVPPTGNPGTAVATITVNPVRNAQGQVTSGSILFTLRTDIPGPITFTGLHIHEGAAGANGGVIFDTGTNAGANRIESATGKEFINIRVPVPNPNSNATQQANQIAALGRLLNNPAGFYVNIHSTVNTGGVVRAQLTGLAAPLLIASSNKYFLPTGSADTTLALLAATSNLPDLLLGSVVINGQQVQAVPDLATGVINVTVPAALIANPGILAVQLRTPGSLLTAPLLIPVAAQASVNAQAVTTTDAARFVTNVAAESLGAAFGTRLAANTVAATTLPLPVTLDGTTVYVNGVQAQLVFVSANQINYVIPEGTAAGPAAVVVRASDGTISQGTVLVTNVAPGIFTRTGNGLGAPAAVASTDGQNFNILTSNADGTPVELQAGNFVALFGTGLRFVSYTTTVTPPTPNATIAAGGVSGTPLFVGAQGTFTGLDQVNFQIPQALAGRGELDLVLTVDGRAANTVKIKVK